MAVVAQNPSTGRNGDGDGKVKSGRRAPGEFGYAGASAIVCCREMDDGSME